MTNLQQIKLGSQLPSFQASVVLEHLLAKNSFTRLQMQTIIENIFQQVYSNEWLAAFMIALRCKGETLDEVLGACDVLQKMQTPVVLPENIQAQVVDVVGTGGDGFQTFNISTAAMFIAAAGGAYVAKHGGRGVSSKSGSADCITALGIDLNFEKISEQIQTLGLGFMFAPNHHPAMLTVAQTRKQLGVRTIFNLLGPLCNPAGVKRILLGVYDAALLPLMAEVLQAQNYTHAWVVCSNGLDEISSINPTQVAEVKNQSLNYFTITPEDYGFNLNSNNYLNNNLNNIKNISVNSAEESAKILEKLFSLDVEEIHAQNLEMHLDMVIINAAAVLYLAGVADDLKAGIEIAKKARDAKKAQRILQALRS